MPPTVPLSPSHALQLCERCQQEILDLNDCTTPTWVGGWVGGRVGGGPGSLTRTVCVRPLAVAGLLPCALSRVGLSLLGVHLHSASLPAICAVWHGAIVRRRVQRW